MTIEEEELDHDRDLVTRSIEDALEAKFCGMKLGMQGANQTFGHVTIEDVKAECFRIYKELCEEFPLKVEVPLDGITVKLDPITRTLSINLDVTDKPKKE